MKKIIILFLPCLLMNVVVFAQPTGLWSDVISFSTPSYPGQTRTIVYRAPSNYSTRAQYKIFICLHGQGDNPNNYSQVIAQVYMQQSSFGNVIMLAPSEGAAQSGFTEPIGEDDGLMEAMVAHALTIYPNLDTTKIYMTGFSRGARSGLKIGLDKPLKYRGMMLYTPALLSMNEAQNLTSYTFNYSNGQYVPICMTVGANDPNGYPARDAEVQNQLAAAGAQSILISMPGVGHNIPQTMQDYLNCYNFCETHLYTPSTGIDDQEAIDAAGIDLFPNPASGGFFVSLNVKLSPDDDVTTTVYNIAGQKVYEQKNHYINQVHFVNMEKQPSGMYMVEIIAPFGRFAKKIHVNN